MTARGGCRIYRERAGPVFRTRHHPARWPGHRRLRQRRRFRRAAGPTQPAAAVAAQQPGPALLLDRFPAGGNPKQPRRPRRPGGDRLGGTKPRPLADPAGAVSWPRMTERLIFGLGEAGPDRVGATIQWPSGHRQRLSGLNTNRYHTVVEEKAPSGTVAGVV